ncbi:hypothetical protein DH2020_022220 [Rehmannia glutinosa]|uniref:Protein kinase domain-containing protein n=1 Tax=Rehmannia glutinosa TaxID=99300 RepID=A0ABR0WE31_REHGL
MAKPLLLLLHAAVLLTYAVGTLSLPPCAPCGSTPVPYPLSTAPNCGDPSYRIRCSAGALLFDSSNNTYPITSISPSIQRLTVAPSSFIPNTCIAADLPLQRPPAGPLRPLQHNQQQHHILPQLHQLHPQFPSQLHLRQPLPRLRQLDKRGERVRKRAVLRVPCRWFDDVVQDTGQGIRVPGVQEFCEFGLRAAREPVAAAQRGAAVGFAAGAHVWRARGLWVGQLGTGEIFLFAQNNKGVKCLTVGLGVALISALIGFLVYKRHRRIKEEQERLTREREEILNSGGGKTAKIFTGKDIKKATNNFAKDRLLGVGGYGEVYKGILEDGTTVAVKCAKLGNTKGTDQVLNEVRILCQVNHKSLVRLLGCCVELEQPLLVYEYIPNGTLLDHLQGSNRGLLSWKRRLSIAHATAEGLSYLHFSAVPPIYHRDVKSSNILLDEKLNGKVADFGLSRLAHTDLSHISTCAQGTLGYLDPEYYRNYQLTDKSDVYSFGVVLLELLTSQKAIDFNRPPDDVNLAVYVQRLVGEERVMDGVDPMLKEGASTLELETMKALGFLAVGCLEERRQNRPSMKEVAEEIEYIISIMSAKAAE